MKKAFLWCILLMNFFSNLVANVDVEVRYTQTEEIRQVPLIVNLAEARGKGLYLSRVRSLQIETLSCDGAKLPISASDITVYEEARHVAAVEADSYVYMIPARGRLIFAKKLGEKGMPDDVVAITIPDRWESLELAYKIRFSDGSLSRTYTARFSRLSVDEMIRAQEEESRRIQRGP